jgi:tape measure domain-containing protein
LALALREISGVYDGFNTLSKQASLSTAESASVFTQLSQALGSGVLRGDEFNRMAESMPAILGVVAKELGVSQNALRGMAADGKISADVVVRGLKKVADAGGDLDKFLDPSTKAMNKLAKESENAQVALGNST